MKMRVLLNIIMKTQMCIMHQQGSMVKLRFFLGRFRRGFPRLLQMNFWCSDSIKLSQMHSLVAFYFLECLSFGFGTWIQEFVKKSDTPLHVKYLQTMVECLCMLGKVAAAGAIIWCVALLNILLFLFDLVFEIEIHCCSIHLSCCVFAAI